MNRGIQKHSFNTSEGEVSVSTRDLLHSCGPPVVGSCYDEVIPKVVELKWADSANPHSLSRSCSTLFYAFHILCRGRNKVKISDWIAFWFWGPSRHLQIQKQKNTVSNSRSSQNPTGDLSSSEPLSQHHDVFLKLKVEEKGKLDTYLAAFLILVMLLRTSCQRYQLVFSRYF